MDDFEIPVFEPDRENRKVRRHADICMQLNDLYARKNADYGDSFGESFKKWGMPMSLIRLGDKLSRCEKLVISGERKVTDESIKDTLMDLANYSIMTLIELEGE